MLEKFDITIFDQREGQLVNELIHSFLHYIKYYYNREKYDLKWVFRRSKNDFQRHCDNIELHLNKEDDSILGEIDHAINENVLKAIKRNNILYQAAFIFFIILEFILSVLLIYCATNVLHILENHLLLEGSLIIFAFAIIKVVLDKKFLEPFVHKFGWKLYRKSIETSTSLLITSLIIIELIEVYDFEIENKQDVLIFKKTINELVNEIISEFVCVDKNVN